MPAYAHEIEEARGKVRFRFLATPFAFVGEWYLEGEVPGDDAR